MQIIITPWMVYLFLILSVTYVYCCIWWAGYAAIMDAHVYKGHRPATLGAVVHMLLVFLLNLFLMPVALTMIVIRFDKHHKTTEGHFHDTRPACQRSA